MSGTKTIEYRGGKYEEEMGKREGKDEEKKRKEGEKMRKRRGRGGLSG